VVLDECVVLVGRAVDLQRHHPAVFELAVEDDLEDGDVSAQLVQG
jgi:hypothetical protein